MIGYLEQGRIEGVASTNNAKRECVLRVIGNQGSLYSVRQPRLRLTSRKGAVWGMGAGLV